MKAKVIDESRYPDKDLENKVLEIYEPTDDGFWLKQDTSFYNDFYGKIFFLHFFYKHEVEIQDKESEEI